MDASKENAKIALERYQKADDTEEDMDFVTKFLEAAEKRLPSQAAIDKDKERKRQYSKNKKASVK